MSLSDILNASKIKQENDKLKAQLKELSTPEYLELTSIRAKIAEAVNNHNNIRNETEKLQNEADRLNNEIAAKKEKLIILNEEELMQSFGLYQPLYDFAASDIYKAELDSVRSKQKVLIKDGRAATGNMTWTVNNNLAQGRKMVKDMQKLLIRAFNSECDETIEKVKYNNIDQAVKRMRTSKDAISKLGQIMNVSITEEYYLLKIKELHLSYEYQVKKQEEKEEQKRIREELREQAKLEKEIEAARIKIEKEQTHYNNLLSKILLQLSKEDLSPELRAELEMKKIEAEAQLTELGKAMEDVDYRAANVKAGYVYIISNIGSFGENIYKIGMTRRLDPQDRIDELGDASVPFKFDIHAMIFSDNAPGLEAALHNAFDDRKVNMVNGRKEFFNVTLEEIEAVVKANYDKTVEFTRFAPAEQYRESEKIREVHNKSN